MRTELRPSEMREKKSFTVFDTKYLWSIFTGHKKWFALSVILCLCCGVGYIYFSRPVFNIVGKMMLIDRRQNSSSAVSTAGMALLNQLPLSLGSNLSLGRTLGAENEKEILTTYLLSKDVVEDLGLYIEYRHQRFLKSRLLYKNQPLHVEVSPQCIQVMNDDLPLKVSSIKLTLKKSDACYTISGVLQRNSKKTDIPEQIINQLPAKVHTEIGDLTISENTKLTAEQQKPFIGDYQLEVEIVPPLVKAKQFVKRLSVETASKKATSIIQISILDESILRGIDYVNSLVAHYNDRSNKERQEEAAKNEEFVNSRLSKIDHELGMSDADWEKLKRQYQVTDPKVDAEEVMGKKSVYESQLVTFGIQHQLLDYLNEYVKEPSNLYELIPLNIGTYGNDISVSKQNNLNNTSYSGDASSLIRQHNALVSERNRYLMGSSEKAPLVQQLTQQIIDLHPAILEALHRDMHTLAIKKHSVEQEYNRYMSRVQNVPEQERVMTELSRQRTIMQGVFISLLQKREEYAMELANTTNKGRLIDETQSLKKTKPKSMVALLVSSILGMLLPYVLFFYLNSRKKTIESEVDLKQTTRLPLLGTISYSGQGEYEDVFRMIRANLLHMLRDDKKTILLTSANEGDGKTFGAVRLAKAFARMGEKTVVCDLNFFHPSVSKEFAVQEQSGLTDLLLDSERVNEKIESTIVKTTIQDLYVLPSGSVGKAHPTDLIVHKGLRKVLNCLRESYDIIILDSPAVGENIDPIIANLSDVTCFVCRSGKTTKVALENLEKLKIDKHPTTPCLVLNQ